MTAFFSVYEVFLWHLSQTPRQAVLPTNATSSAVLFCNPAGGLLGTCSLAPVQAFVVFLFQLHHKRTNGVLIVTLEEEGAYAH